jgi:predicted nucleic acid-binding protein
MKAFRVVADSSCLIALAQIELFGLLQEVFSQIYIPRSVYEEAVVKGKGEPGSGETESALKHGVSSQLIFPIKSHVIFPVNEVGLSKV